MTTIMNNINKMFPSIEKRLDFLSLVTLEYGLSLDFLEELLGVDKETLYQELVKNNMKYNSPLYRRFSSPAINQEEARRKFKEYIKELTYACIDKDVEKIRTLLREVSDKDINEFVARKVKGQKIEDEEMLMILKYQIKYQLNAKELCAKINMNYASYKRRVLVIIEKYPEYQAEYDTLANIYYKSERSHHHG